jgi:hypothetical protein
MTRLEDRQILMRDIAQARADGARLAPAVLWLALIPGRCSAGRPVMACRTVTVGQMPIVRLHRTH